MPNILQAAAYNRVTQLDLVSLKIQKLHVNHFDGVYANVSILNILTITGLNKWATKVTHYC